MLRNFYVKKDYFEDFDDEYLEFKFRVQSILEERNKQLDDISNSENEKLENEIVYLEEEI